MTKPRCEMMGADEVAETLGTSRAYAYKLIRRLNEEREGAGHIVVAGKISRVYFEERVFGIHRKREGM